MNERFELAAPDIPPINISYLSRGRQPGGDAPLSATDVSANTQPSNNLPQKRSDDSPHEDLAPVSHVVSVQPHGDILKLKVQEVPTESEVHLTKNRDGRSEQNPKPSLRAKEQLLKARLLHYAESSQQIQTHAQVCSDYITDLLQFCFSSVSQFYVLVLCEL